MAASTDAKRPEELTPYEAVLRSFLYWQRYSAEDHLVARAALERAVELEPGYADAWACLSLVLLDEYRHGFNPRPGALDGALKAAQRAVDADASPLNWPAVLTKSMSLSGVALIGDAQAILGWSEFDVGETVGITCFPRADARNEPIASLAREP